LSFSTDVCAALLPSSSVLGAASDPRAALDCAAEEQAEEEEEHDEALLPEEEEEHDEALRNQSSTTWRKDLLRTAGSWSTASLQRRMSALVFCSWVTPTRAPVSSLARYWRPSDTMALSALDAERRTCADTSYERVHSALRS